MEITNIAERRRQTSPMLVKSESDPLSVLRVALEAAPQPVIISSARGAILFSNALANALFAYGPRELAGQPIARVLPESSSSEDTGLPPQFWSDPERVTPGHVVTGVRKDGARLKVEIGLNALTDHGAPYLVTSVVDVTAQHALDTQLAALTHEHQGFQRLVADLAVRLGRITDDALDATIVDGLRQIGEALHLDRAVLWHQRAGAAVALPTHDWGRGDHPPAPAAVPIAALPYVLARLTAGEVCGFETVEALPDPADRETFRQHGLRSYLVVPVPAATDRDGDLRALGFGTRTRPQAWTPPLVERLRLVAAVMSQAIARTASQASLQHALTEIRDLRSRLGRETGALHNELRSGRTPSIVVSESPAIRQVLAQIDQVAPTPATVLLLGETGVGKEVMAQAIHDRSPRHQRPMIRVSCAAIPTALIESELFGRERGAYTGALSRQIGRFEAANQSTLFLDEIGDLPMEVQVKLLRVLQERTVERLGSTQPVKVDVRIIAATNRNLEDAVTAKTFREDLFYRLNVFPIVVPPLRTRV
jgi:formate hydrogenlyase transcriptional activator